MEVTTEADGSQFVRVFSGTSFSAPQVSGAVALLSQAFPNLSAQEIVSILLDSARDAGAAGTDAVYGRGILDVARAFQPIGATSLAGTSEAIGLDETLAVGSAPMGDAFANASLETILTDVYGRAYTVDLSAQMRGAASRERLRAAVGEGGSRQVGAGGQRIALAFTLDTTRGGPALAPMRLTRDEADQSRVLAARVAVKLGAGTDIALGIAENSAGLVAQLQRQWRPAFLLAPNAAGDTGFTSRAGASIAVRRQFGGWGLTASGQTGEVFPGGGFSDLRNTGAIGGDPDTHRMRSFTMTADRRFGDLATTLGATLLEEDSTVLGGRFHQTLGAAGARSLFLDGLAHALLGATWRLGGAIRYGRSTAEQSGLVLSGSRFASIAWSLDLERNRIFQPSDSLGVRLSQPLRVESGGLMLSLPTGYDYRTEQAVNTAERLSLAPQGRELMGELSWRGTLLGGHGQASLFVRHQPGHVRTAAEDAGVALRWSRAF